MALHMLTYLSWTRHCYVGKMFTCQGVYCQAQGQLKDTCVVVIFTMYEQQRLFDLMRLKIWAHVDIGFCGFPQGPFFGLEAKRGQCPASTITAVRALHARLLHIFGKEGKKLETSFNLQLSLDDGSGLSRQGLTLA